MHSNIPKRFNIGCSAAAVVALTLSLSVLHSATIDKADNTVNLSDGSSWAGGGPPTSQDFARWGNSVSAASSAALGADVSWGSIVIADPAGEVGIQAGHTLTLGRSGIDMSAATHDFSISSGLSPLTNTHQVWNLGTGRSLNLNTGVFVRGANATLNVQGGGVVTTTMTGLSKTTLVNNIIGSWASFDTGSYTSYATINGSNAIVGLGYTGARTARQSPIPLAWSRVLETIIRWQLEVPLVAPCNTSTHSDIPAVMGQSSSIGITPTSME